MAQPSASASRSSLGPRVLSALVLAPIAVAMAWLGGWALAGFTLLAAVLMAFEWSRLTGAGARGWTTPAAIAVIVATWLAAALGAFGWALWLIVLGAAAAAGLAGIAGRSSAWLGGGILYIGLPCLALLWLRGLSPLGLETVLWVLALVWAVDIGAYVAGRGIGGPKLAPRISPNKTWAGLGGGVLGGILVGALTAQATAAPLPAIAALSAGLAILGQAGDLMESAIKRHFHVKDAGHIIPGHGGVLDRVDGLIAVLLGVAALSLAGGGSPLGWR
jgi:phosphatidate cytidylyltransferase